MFSYFTFTKHLFLFCNDLVPMRIDFLFVEVAIEKHSTKIRVEKFCHTLYRSCPGIAVKSFKNTSEVITKTRGQRTASVYFLCSGR